MVVLAIGGCVRPTVVVPPPVVSAVGPSQRVMVEARVSDEAFFDPMTGRVRLGGAVNSVVAFQLMISALNAPASGIQLAVDDFAVVAPIDRATTQAAEDTTGSVTARDSVRMYRQWPVVVERYANWYLRSVGSSRRREIPDALVPMDAPRNGQPIDLSPGKNVVIWVEVGIPRDARPGDYLSMVTIHSVGSTDVRVPVDLKVRDVFLPTEALMPAFAGVQLGPIISAHTGGDPKNLRAALDDPVAREAMIGAFRLLHDHGLSPFTTDVKPRLSQDVSGKLSVDWSEYDAFCEPLIVGTAYSDGRAAAGWPLPVDMQQPDPVQYDGMQTPGYAAVMRDYVRECSFHFSQKEWLHRGWVWVDVARGPESSAGELSDFRRIAELINPSESGAPRIPFVSTLIPQSMQPFGWLDYRFDDLSTLVDVWATPARYHHRATLERLRASGKKHWLRPDQPPYCGSLEVEASPVQARSLAMQAFLEGADALMIEHATAWPPKVFDESISDRRARSDTWLLYPGDSFGLKQPVPSMRLKQLQLGLQDVQLLRLLDLLGHTETARLLAGSLIKSWGTDAYGDNYLDGVFGRRSDDPMVWHLARELLLDEVTFAVSERPEKSIDRAANRAAWAKFLSATRRIEVTPESSRLSLVRRTVTDALTGEKRPGRALAVTHEVSVRNEMRTSVNGDLKLSVLPPGGKPRQDMVRVGPIGEMDVVRRALSWELESILPCDLDGHYVQRVSFDSGQVGEIQADCVLSMVQAPLVETPPTVDGNLGDWVPSEYNSAGDFRLITGASDRGEGGTRRDSHTSGEARDGILVPADGLLSAAARPRATSQTVAYFCRDQEHLYIGLHAAAPERVEADDLSKRITSDVEYDELMPVGEDLIEVVLDPTNRGTRPDDLYHVVLKSNGIAVFEKGVGVVPPICQRGPWPSPEPPHAVQRTSFGWSAEIAIPLKAFGAVPANAVWGLNVTRLEPTRGEYSDWSRVPRHSYDPRVLGNLIWSE
ncbi:MAG: hypothetical protein AABZ08_03365 [Planctomycetota bacterium]